MSETTTLTYRQLGERFGISPDAARMKARRAAKAGRWIIVEGNHPGATVHVTVPIADLPLEPPVNSVDVRPVAPDGVATLLAMLEAERRRRAELEAELDRFRDQLEAKRVGTAVLAAELEHAERELERERRRARWRR